MNYSRFIGVGNVGTMPSISRLPSGGMRGYFRVCFNDVWKDKGGTRRQRENWYSVVAFQKGDTGLLTSVFPLIRKGQLVMLEASPVIRKWKNKDGVEVESFELQIGPNDTIMLLGGKANGTTAQDAVPGPSADAPPDDYTDDIPL